MLYGTCTILARRFCLQYVGQVVLTIINIDLNKFLLSLHMVKFQLSLLIIWTLLASCSGSAVLEAQNGISLGESELKIRVISSAVPIDNIEVWASVAPIFCNFNEWEEYPLSLQDSVFVGKIPTELIDDVIGLTFESPEGYHGRLLQVRQGAENIYEVEISADFSFDWGDKPDFEGLTAEDWARIGESGDVFFASHDIETPLEKYSDWKRVREFENDTLWPRNMAATGLPQGFPKWIENSFRCRFASTITMPYVQSFTHYTGTSIAEPPMESHSFLNTISYDEDSFLKRLPYTGLKSFLYALLRFPEGGFDPIGEQSVSEWENVAKNKLSRAISNPTQLLLDLLSAMSYVEQIDIRNIPLTEKQIENVKLGYRDGLKDIILKKNNKLTTSLSNADKYKDLCDAQFSLKHYIDSVYPGQPIVVDTWGTWCRPCLDAIAKTELIRSEHKFDNIVFLYIATEATPIEAWRKKASEIEGEHVRINDNDTEALGETYGLIGFPSYLFFDADHNLLKKYPYFPGEEIYLQMLDSMSVQ